MKAIKWLLVLVFLSTTVLGHTQDSAAQASPPAKEQVERNEYVLQARLIKVKRMSEAWQNEPVKLLLFGGTSDQGRFLSIHNNAFRLQAGSGIKEIPVAKVETIVLKRKPQNLFFVGMTTAGVAALFVGGASLGFDASERGMIGASVAGAIVGFTVGWKAFYQNIEIPLD